MHTIYVVFQSYGSYDVPRISITDARSFQAFAAILDWLTRLASISYWYRSDLNLLFNLWISKVRGYDQVCSRRPIATNKIHTQIPTHFSNLWSWIVVMLSQKRQWFVWAPFYPEFKNIILSKKKKKNTKKKQTLRGKNFRKLVIRSNFHHKKIIMPTFQALTLHQKKQRDCRLTT